MISLVALAFAGVFFAIYMRVNMLILEILAGVPTIVYGVFALLIVPYSEMFGMLPVRH